MNAGKLDRRISFERFTLVDDGFTKVEEFAAHGSPVWASKVDVSDGEKMRSDGVAAMLTSRFVIRSSEFSRGITPKDRITYKGETFAIFGIKENGRNKMLEITAGARVDDES